MNVVWHVCQTVARAQATVFVRLNHVTPGPPQVRVQVSNLL